MKNDPFEKKIRDLPWRQPPEDLKQRVFQDAPDRGRVIEETHFSHWNYLGWAAALIVFGAVITYTLVQRSVDAVDPNDSYVAETEPQPISAVVEGNFFDFTVAQQDPWPGEMEFELQASEGGDQ